MNLSKIKCLALTLAVWLSACGGGDEARTELSGVVRDASGVAVANAHVLAMNRRSNDKFEAFTDPNGRYVVSVPRGYYDLASDDGQLTQATWVGPVGLSQTEFEQNFSLPEGGRPDAVVGQLLLANGEPAVGHVLHVRSQHKLASQDPGLDITLSTDAGGRFEVDLGQQRLFDLDIHDGNDQFLESVDVHKVDGTLALQLRLSDSASRNVYRYDERPPVVPTVSALIASAAVAEKDFVFESHWHDVRNATEMAHALGAGYLCRISSDWGTFVTGEYAVQCLVRLSQGKLAVGAGPATVGQFTSYPVYSSINRMMGVDGSGGSGDHVGFEVKADGSAWYKYAVHAKMPDGAGSCDWVFWDETEPTYAKDSPEVLSGQAWCGQPKAANISGDGDALFATGAYHLSASTQGDHTVSYNSDQPTVHYINSFCTIDHTDLPPGAQPDSTQGERFTYPCK